MDLLRIALTHSTYGEHEVTDNYDRLEFLGDSIIKSILSEWLYINYPFEDSGYYTKSRERMEEGTFLLELGKQFELDKYIIKGKSLNIEDSPFVYEDMFEAMVGCIYLQNGYKKTTEFIIETCTKDFQNLNEPNYIVEVNEYIQNKNKENIDIFECHQKENGQWFCSANDNGRITSGIGKNKKIAQKEASKLFYEKYM